LSFSSLILQKLRTDWYICFGNSFHTTCSTSFTLGCSCFQALDRVCWIRVATGYLDMLALTLF